MDRISMADALRRGLLAYTPYLPAPNQMKATAMPVSAPRLPQQEQLDMSRVGAALAGLKQEEAATETSPFAPNTTPMPMPGFAEQFGPTGAQTFPATGPSPQQMGLLANPYYNPFAFIGAPDYLAALLARGGY